MHRYEEAEDEAAANAHQNAAAAPAITGAGLAPVAVAPAATTEHEDIPAYSGAAKSSGVEIGPNGYAVEKKAGPSGIPAAGEPSQDAGLNRSASSAGKEVSTKVPI